MVTWGEGSLNGECIRMADWFRSTAETNTMLQSNYIPIKIILKNTT